MSKTLEIKTREEKKHFWGKPTEYKLNDSEDFLDYVEGEIEGNIKILKKMGLNQYFVVKTLPAEIRNINTFDNYINNLKSLSLDIGKGNCEYGYKMPLPEKGESRRELIIFRRRIAENE